MYIHPHAHHHHHHAPTHSPPPSPHTHTIHHHAPTHLPCHTHTVLAVASHIFVRLISFHPGFLYGFSMEFQCKKCDKTFSVKSNLTRHVKGQHGQKINCPHSGCQSQFALPQTLKEHLCTHSKATLIFYKRGKVQLRPTTAALQYKKGDEK